MFDLPRATVAADRIRITATFADATAQYRALSNWPNSGSQNSSGQVGSGVPAVTAVVEGETRDRVQLQALVLSAPTQVTWVVEFIPGA
jgi:hypothetical protein